MAEQRIGSCSVCGGDVVAWFGGWLGIGPPPPAHCRMCSARTKDDVIQMAKPRGYFEPERPTALCQCHNCMHPGLGLACMHGNGGSAVGRLA